MLAFNRLDAWMIHQWCKCGEEWPWGKIRVLQLSIFKYHRPKYMKKVNLHIIVVEDNTKGPKFCPWMHWDDVSCYEFYGRFFVGNMIWKTSSVGFMEMTWLENLLNEVMWKDLLGKNNVHSGDQPEYQRISSNTLNKRGNSWKDIMDIQKSIGCKREPHSGKYIRNIHKSIGYWMRSNLKIHQRHSGKHWMWQL